MTIIIDSGDLVLRAGPPGGKPLVQAILSPEDAEDPMQQAIRIIQDAPQEDKAQSRVIATVPLQCGVLTPSILCQHYFEVAGAGSVCLAQAPFLAALGSGASSAVVCDCGHRSTRVSHVQDGWIHHSSSVVSAEVSGVSQNRLLEGTGVTRARDVHGLKVATAWVPRDGDAATDAAASFTLPDGTAIERSASTAASLGEFPFAPNDFLSLRNVLSVSQLVQLAVFAVPEEVQPCGNVVLCGGLSAMRGFAGRLTDEVCGKTDGGRIRVQCLDDPHLLAWRGGSVLSQLSAVGNISVSRAEYMEYGPNVVHRRCL